MTCSTTACSVDWVTELAQYAHKSGLIRIAATTDGTEHVKPVGQGKLANEAGSWMPGINRNVEGRQIRKIMCYSGGYRV